VVRRRRSSRGAEPLERRRLLSVTFLPQQTYAVGGYPAQAAVEDLGNGHPDLVVANNNDATVSVLLGNGDGTFQPQTTYAVGSGAISVAVANLGNGHPDLVVANYLDATVSVLLGNGDGTFGAQTTYATGPSPYDVALADLGNGHLDILTANNADAGTVSVLLGNGDGTFAAARSVTVGKDPTSLAVADLGNGHPDLVVSNFGDNTVSVLLGNGNGTFGAQHTDAVGTGPSCVAVDNLGNGHPDIVTTNQDDATASVLLGNGDGTFAAQTTYAVGANPLFLAVDDLGNGKQDLVVANGNDNDVSVLLGNGDGTFAAQTTYAVGTDPVGVTVADLGNGHPDIITPNSDTTGTVSVLLGNGGDTLAFAQQPANGTVGAPLPTVRVDVLGPAGTVSAADTTNVTLSVATGPTGETLGGTTTVAAAAGVATFANLTLGSAGTYTIKATDGTDTGVVSTSFTVVVGTGTTDQLAFTQQPVATTAGSTLAPVKVAVEGPTGALLTTDASTVTLRIANGPAGVTLGGTATVAAVGGVATFSTLTLATAGTYTLVATDGTDTSATSASFTVSNPGADQLAFATEPTTAVAGATLPPITVDVEGPTGSLLTTDTSTVTLALSGTGATLGGTRTVAAIGGVATFSDLTVSAAGTYTLTASDGGDTAGTSTPFTISPAQAGADHLAFAQQPTFTAVDTVLQAVTVRVNDAIGSLQASDASLVTLAIASGPSGAVLGGTTTVAAVGGVATFADLTLSALGSYRLVATDGSDVPVTSASFSVARDTATPGNLSGTVFTDANGDGALSTGEVGLAGVTVYLDVDGDAALTADEPSAVTAADGSYTIDNVPSGPYTLREVVPSGYTQTLPVAGGYAVNVPGGQTGTAPSFGDEVSASAVTLPASTLTAQVLTKPAARVLGSTTATIKVQLTDTAAVPFTGPVTITVYLSPNVALSSSAVFADSVVTKRLTLKPARSTTVPIKFTYPASLPNATYQLVVAAAATSATGGAITQPATAVGTRAVFITAPVVDLSASLPASVKVKPGKPTSVAVTLKNLGTTTAVGFVKIVLYASTTGVADGSAIPLQTIPSKSLKLAPNRSTAFKLAFVAPDQAAGTYQLVAVVSPTTNPADDNDADDTAVAATK
jgi:hypothetical protein